MIHTPLYTDWKSNCRNDHEANSTAKLAFQDSKSETVGTREKLHFSGAIKSHMKCFRPAGDDLPRMAFAMVACLAPHVSAHNSSVSRSPCFFSDAS